MVNIPEDSVILRLPTPGAEWLPLIRVVVDGVAMRKNLPLDDLDDLHLAIESLLVEETAAGGAWTVEVRGEKGNFCVVLGGLTNLAVKTLLEGGASFRPGCGCSLDLSLLLGSLVDGYQVRDEPSGCFAVELTKRVA